MSEEKKNMGEKSGRKEPIDTDKLIEATKKMADKAENYVAETAKKVKKSEAFGKLKEMVNKIEDFVDEKSDEFNKSGMADKLESMKDKAGAKADELMQKAKAAGQDIVQEVDEAIDSIKENINKKKKP
jgi:ElaB/YqjD/DUF883 family membrane-anchored ribosome-binding protein